MQRKALGVAVIGCGRIGALRAKLAAEHPAVTFVALADRDPARARRLEQRVLVGHGRALLGERDHLGAGRLSGAARRVRRCGCR